MATIGGDDVLTLTDWATRLDPDRTINVADMVELLAQSNPILDDMLWIEGNLPTGHRTTVRTGLPTPVWRKLNEGVQPTKSRTAQIDESIGMLEDWSVADKDLAELAGQLSQFRLSEAVPHVEGMNQEFAQTVFYGDHTTAPEEFLGLANRYTDLSADNGKNIVDGGGAGSDNTSIWLVVWGRNTCCGIFPKGSQAGILHEDLGLGTVDNANGVTGAKMRAYQDHWQWKGGLNLKDWRYVVRIANIDISNLVTESSAADLIKLMLKAIHRIPAMGMGMPVFYANRSVVQMLDIQAMEKTNVHLSVGNEEGNPKLSIRGIPIKKVDQLLETEGTIS